jgi:N-acetylglutamate synthase-like GNAT family acetyltransferase
MIISIDELGKYDLSKVRHESDKEGYNHINRLVSDYDSGGNKFDKKGEKLIGFLMNGEIVALCGLNIEPTNNRLGRIRRLYVLKNYRHRGIDTELVKYLVNQAKPNFEGVVVNIGNLAVDNFYKSIGFNPVTNNDSYTHILMGGHL